MNPSIVEWIYSPIIYYQSQTLFREQSKILLHEQKRLFPLIIHYLSMTKSSYKTNIEGKNSVSAKKYLHVIRPGVMIEWLLLKNKNNNELIEIDFTVLLNTVKDCLNETCYTNILELVESKKLNNSNLFTRFLEIDKWIEGLLKIDQSSLHEKNEIQSNDKYDNFLFSILNI